ncbi:MAG: S1/P1 nuclease [Gammaproteobacteria bacterium]|nr:S1/P1 nuclease [Gammaproteobacteria bacterium]
MATMALSLLFTFTFSQSAIAWGKNGHRIVGKIAENHLTPTTLKEVYKLLDDDKLAEVGTWADEMRSNPSEFWQKKSPRWHYISISSLDHFHPEQYDHSSEISNIYIAIRRAIDVLKSPSTSVADKKHYLRFLVHLVADVHQPLHVGRSEDRGGNRIDVRFFNREVNLHTLWDTTLVENEQLSYSEFVDFIDTKNPQLVQEYLATRPADWVKESFHLVQGIYEVGDKDYRYNYVYKYMPLVKERLLQAGIRLAGTLNEIFDPNSVAGISSLKQP